MEWLIDGIIRPIAHRAGTALGAYLTAQGISADDINLLVAAVPVAIGLLWDLGIRRIL